MILLRWTVLSVLRRMTFEDHPKNQAKGILKESWTSVSVCSGTNFKDHPKNQAKGILKGVLPLVSFVHFTWKSEGKASERNGLKRGVVFHQGFLSIRKTGVKVSLTITFLFPSPLLFCTEFVMWCVVCVFE